MIPINKRNIQTCILLTIFTCGIYGIYWNYLLVKNIRAITKDSNSCTGEMLCLTLVPFYSVYWWYTRGRVVKDQFAEHGYSAKGSEIAFLILALHGLSIVSMAIMQSDFNALPYENTHSIQRIAIKDMCYIALMAAVICVIAPYSIDVGPVPISLATFAVYLAGAVLGFKKGTAAVGIYLLLGAVGVPVFAGFSSGFAKLTGPTGGYLIGYLPCVAITGIGVDLLGERRINVFKHGFSWSYPVFMVLGTLVLYLLGTVWFVISTGYTFAKALPLCVTPFLPGDAIKIVLATVLGEALRRRLKAMGLIGIKDKTEKPRA